jgi:tRNA A-37 threonylcarbamoyl transferase component Bud32
VEGHACGRPSATPVQHNHPSVTAFIGKLLGQNYRIVEPIGAGAMGMVYVVEHVTLRKRFAAKLLTADLARRAEAVARFEVEAHAASQLDHENIVSVIDFGTTDDGCVYLIMELLRGKTLQARMDQGRPTLEEIVAIILQVCRALAAAHAAGIVHRDMKPDNIFLTQRPGGRPMVKVLDFGISKAREGTLREGRITKQGQLLGSPEYMSPEASRGDEVDYRADIYAVGIMLYELLCGEVPFRHENYLKVLQMHAGQPPRAPRELVPDMPVQVEYLIMRALEKDPRRRHDSIEELEAELLAALPEVAQRALLQIQTPAHSQWLPAQSQPMRYVSGAYQAMGDVPAPPHHEQVGTTLDTRRAGLRGPVVLLWTGVLVLVAAAAALVYLRSTANEPASVAAPAKSREAARVEPHPAASPQSPSAAVAAAEVDPPAADEASAGEIRLRIETNPPGATATLQGKLLGLTPIDRHIAASDREGELELDLHGYRPTSRSVPLDRDGELRIVLHRESHRSKSRTAGKGSSSSGKSPGRRGSDDDDDDDDRSERPPAPVDLDIKEGR